MGKIRIRNKTILALLLFLVPVMVLSACLGALDIAPDEMMQAFSKGIQGLGKDYTLSERIFLTIRLPRVFLCCFVGACLSVGGLLLQSIFRNPIIEPGLIGTSSGAAFGASLYFVFGAGLKLALGEWVLPLAATTGAVAATFMVLTLSRSGKPGKSNATSLLLTGIAINALFLSGIGFLSFLARDPQARSITFWGLGTLSGASWNNTAIVGFVTVLCIAGASRYGNALSVLSLGESEALLLGIDVKKMRVRILLLNVIMIATATAFVGNISFVGLIVPHLMRLLKMDREPKWILGCALSGAILLSLADVVARILLRPAELPIGIVTSVIGVPVFLVLLRRKNYFFQ